MGTAGHTHQEGAVHPGGRFVAGEKPDDLEGKGVHVAPPARLRAWRDLPELGFPQGTEKGLGVGVGVVLTLTTPDAYFQLLQSQKPCPRAVVLAPGRGQTGQEGLSCGCHSGPCMLH